MFPDPASERNFTGATTRGLRIRPFGFYLISWFWTQWRADAPTEGRGSTLLKVVFSGFFVYSMARQVKEAAQDRGIACGYSPAVLTALVWVDAIAIRVMPQIWVLIAALLIGLPLVPVQSTINRVSREAGVQPAVGWRWWEVALGVVLGLFCLMSVADFSYRPLPLSSPPTTEGGDRIIHLAGPVLGSRRSSI